MNVHMKVFMKMAETCTLREGQTKIQSHFLSEEEAWFLLQNVDEWKTTLNRLRGLRATLKRSESMIILVNS
ncbi:hypothetical protein PHAVU_008G201500 [Phaseolus vulgaris]|uniref:Uncharacterized protein n=1 Tax=Phaseolus vulgaris TaxID=3885 RepID=V7B6G0_PHAVU|nr:hypothetical protein PHAVU_008G201500g [Phaseolus vulgaris]ESW13497.1 hypothetical protein PHAVU_008G201500g [Phaseolus vulgaris]